MATNDNMENPNRSSIEDQIAFTLKYHEDELERHQKKIKYHTREKDKYHKALMELINEND